MQDNVTHLYQPLLAYVKRRIANRQDAEDLTQEIFYKLAATDCSKIGNVKSWLYTIAKNSVIDYFRRAKIRSSISAGANHIVESLPQEIAAENSAQTALQELADCVRPYVNLLPNVDRELITRVELENIPQRELAAHLGMNYTTLRSKVQRARKKLQNLISACCDVKQGALGDVIEFQQKKPTNECTGQNTCGPC